MCVPRHFWASTLFAIGIFSSIETLSLIMYHGSLTNFTEINLEEYQRILPFFNKSLVTMTYIFGFSEDRNSDGAHEILSAYLSTQYTNVLLLDWSQEGSIDYRGSILSYIFKAVPNAKKVGRRFGHTLMQIIQNGISANRIHLVGHSLGAHVAGYTGEYLNEQGIWLGRITGLDPAGPMFEGPINMGGLQPSSAQFVDVLHSNPSLYGIKGPRGNVDFWANCNQVIQPGCPTNTTLADDNSYCSHRRSYFIFAEAIRSPTAFPASKAASCTNWQYQRNSANIIYFGDWIDTSAQGFYFFSTNSQQPFSKGQAGLTPNN